MIRYLVPILVDGDPLQEESEPARSLLHLLVTAGEVSVESLAPPELPDRLRTLAAGDIAVLSARFLRDIGVPSWLARVPAWAETRLLVTHRQDTQDPVFKAWAATVDELIVVGGRVDPWPDAVAGGHIEQGGTAGLDALRRALNRRTAPGQLPIVRTLSRCDLPTEHGEFQVTAYSVDGQESALLIAMGELAVGEPPLVRIHSECFTGEVLASLKCDCDAQLRKAMRAVAERGRGAVIYLRQEGRGIGLANKIAAYAEQQRGADTIEANRRLGFPADLRDFTSAAIILRMHGVERVEVMTNNPIKVRTLRRCGIAVSDVAHSVVTPNLHNARYLQVKCDSLGHVGLRTALPAGSHRARPGADLVVFDLDGVIQFGQDVPPAAVAMVDRVRAAGHSVRFLTNDGFNSRASRLEQLRRGGLQVELDELYTTSYLVARYLQPGAPVLALAGAPASDELQGFVQAGADARFVIMGDWFDHYDRGLLQQAFAALQNGAELIAMHRKRHWQNCNGKLIDVGFWVAGLEYCTKRPATVVGKPSAFAYETVRLDAGFPAQRVVMVSDETDPDLQGAQRQGWRTILFARDGATGGDRWTSARDYGELENLLLAGRAAPTRRRNVS